MENRKKLSKTYLAVVLVVLLAVTALTACSSNKNADLEKSSIPEGALASAPAVNDKAPSQFAELVKSGTLTQAQADAVDAAIKTIVAQGKLPHEALGALEDAGTITEEQEQAILKVLTASPPPGAPAGAPPAGAPPAGAPPATAPKAPAAAPAGAPAAPKAPPAGAPPAGAPAAGALIPPVAAVVKAGALDQAKAAAVSAAFVAGKEAGKKPPEVLAELKAAGKITEAEAKALDESFKANAPAGAAPPPQ